MGKVLGCSFCIGGGGCLKGNGGVFFICFWVFFLCWVFTCFAGEGVEMFKKGVLKKREVQIQVG